MKYYKTERDPSYLFTVKNGMAGETLFKAILNTGANVHRWGRRRDRKSVGLSRTCGHVKLEHADRWDLYFNLSDAFYRTGVQLLNNVAELIRRNVGIIEYANPLYKETLESILSIKTSNMKQTPNQTSTWDVTLKSRITVPGTTTEDMMEHLTDLGFRPEDLQAYEKVDEHTDLPLVEFGYIGESGLETKRHIRVTSKDEFYLTGYEENQYKKFRVDRIVGSVELIEMPTPKQ
jgi:hypothetical protein